MYLETNIKTFSAFQKKLHEKSLSLYGEDSNQMQKDMWSQFMNFQGPAMQTMMSTYMDQSKKMVHQMKDQLKSQTLNLFSGIQVPGLGADDARKPTRTDK